MQILFSAPRYASNLRRLGDPSRPSGGVNAYVRRRARSGIAISARVNAPITRRGKVVNTNSPREAAGGQDVLLSPDDEPLDFSDFLLLDESLLAVLGSEPPPFW